MSFFRSGILAGFVLLLAMTPSRSLAQSGSTQAGSAAVAFPPLEVWKNAIKSGNTAGLLSLYSTDPAPQIAIPSGKTNTNISADADAAFWTGLKIRRVKLDLKKSDAPQTGLQQVLFELELSSAATPGKLRTLYISEEQIWQDQSGQWRIVASQRTEPVRLQPANDTTKDIYPAGLDAHAQIRQALTKAAKTRKRVLVVFGANWCYDCHVLDLAFERPELAPVLARNFEVVHVDVGTGDKNQDLMNEYQVPMQRGIPALAVLDSSGKLLYSQKGGEFERARALAPEDLLAFLNKWKPQSR